MPLTTDRNTARMDTDLVVVAVGANVRIFAGALLVANAGGFAVPGHQAAGLKYIGRAEESVDNRGGAAGGRSVQIRRSKAFKWDNDGSVTQTHLFRTAYIVDDATVAADDANGARSVAGQIVAIDPDGVWVEQSH
ncbi:hypothetical protein SAMN05216588_12611 [Pseudomonas flavescens]|uniref:Bacteriophage lambda head decoration protein D n=1 Tax=Phytopseudomonas flavescens TaxID=29435 RepID=A0A1G8NTL7_9GAMM|nr:hypothetical protein [Pseudomonas flavescens]SDI83611.1 hypothetical protein SAMN05216588_12611 [Pseudomonas flavescens]